jgi:signal transduction histidine kinase
MAAEHATREEAVALVKKGVEFYKKNGREKALAAFSDQHGDFVKGELYFFVYSVNGDGIALAHGQNARLIGKSLIDMKTVEGFYPIREATKIANTKEGSGWMSYSWPNSVSKELEKKEAYIERVGDIFIGCGIYSGK